MTLDNNTTNWILDRIDNGEPLYWLEFIKFMRDPIEVSDKTLKRYASKSYKNEAKKMYNRKKIYNRK